MLGMTIPSKASQHPVLTASAGGAILRLVVPQWLMSVDVADTGTYME